MTKLNLILIIKDSDEAEIINGGNYDKSVGYFVQPTIIVTQIRISNQCVKIFGPVITIYIYDENKWEETLKIVDNTSEYVYWRIFSGRYF